MSDGINKSVESSQPIQENIDTNENIKKSTASIESKKGVGYLNTDKPQGLSKEKTKRTAKLVQELIEKETIAPLPALKNQLWKITTDGVYIYIILNKCTSVAWARITIHDDKARKCSLMIYNKENDDWDSCTNGSLPKCIIVADMVCANDMKKWASSIQTKEDNIIESSTVNVTEMVNSHEDDFDAIMNNMSMKVFLSKNIKSVKENVTEIIKQLPELKKRVSKISVSEGCIYLYKIEKRIQHNTQENEAGVIIKLIETVEVDVNAKWLKIQVFNETFTDCTIVLCNKGVWKESGSLQMCLEKANIAAAYI